MKTSGVGMYSRFLSAAALVLYLSACSAPSVSPPVSQDVRETAEEALTADILESEPAVTTSFSDAITEVAFLDAYQPTAWKPLSVLPRAENNWFQLAPGRFEFVSQSYCLHAGTHAPSGGKGYLWASLEGPRAGIIRSILQRSVDHPEIPQRQIQTLIWAVLAQAQFNEMPPQRQAVAATLLTPEELARLNGSALGLVRDQVLERAVQNLPEPARAALRARAELRRRFLDAESTYEDLEEAAVLAGAAPEENEIRHVPASRWSYNPDGYFVRYRPNGYKRLRIQLYVPDRFTLERNAAGAITKIADRAGNRIEVKYADGEEAAPAGGSPASNRAEAAVRAHRIERVRFVRPVRIGPEIAFAIQDSWTDVGWSIVGDQTEELEVLAEPFPGIEARRRKAAAMEGEVARLEGELGAGGTSGTRVDVRDLGHLVLALRASLGEKQLSGWQADHLGLAEEAWAWALCRHLGDCARSADQSARRGRQIERTLSGPRTGSMHGAGSRPHARDLLQQDTPGGPDGGAMPANTSEQRLAPSGRNGGRPDDGGARSEDRPPLLRESGTPPTGKPIPPDLAPPPSDIPRPEPEDYGPDTGGDEQDTPYEDKKDEEEPDEEQCEEVRNQIQWLQRVRDAYQNKEYLEDAREHDMPGMEGDSNELSYDEWVKHNIQLEMAKEEGGDISEVDVEAAMSTDSNCQVDAPPRGTYTGNGTPGVVWDAYRWHEQVHRENCQADPDWYDTAVESPKAMQQEEVEAYNEAIEVLKEYLEAHCGGV